MSTETTPINKAIEKAGGIVALAKSLGLKSHSVINQWRHNRVPADYCPAVEELTGVRCEELRPDIKWGVLRKRAKSAPATAGA